MVKSGEYPVVRGQLKMGAAEPEPAAQGTIIRKMPEENEADGFTPHALVLGRLSKSLAEARRYIELATKAEQALLSGKGSVYWCAEMAEAKRASMDLTRALANVRRGARDA
jgi:hypothetical protein